jgi:glutamate-ammonia-ligase adenylyltransferase
VDIEFVAEYLALAHGPRRPALRWLGVEDILTAATREGLLPPAESDRAIEAYGFLRQLEMRARVMSGRSVRALPADTLELARLARMMAPADIGAGSPTEWLRHAFEEHTAAARELLDRVLGA